MRALVDRRSANVASSRVVSRRVRSAAEACAAPAARTLEDAITGVWQELLGHGVAPCLVCGGGMAPRYGAAGHAPVGGRCVDCGATLS